MDDALVGRMVSVGGKGSHVVDEGFKAEIPSLGRVDVDADAEFFLTNYDLLLSPHGTGKDYRECFESFIADCDDYIRKVTAIRDEARMHMEKLLKAAEEIQ